MSAGAKRISDSVHGTISLEPVEVDIINTGCFQRLRHVKQLGLAHLAYPGLDYSRFSHSIGVCHTTGQIFDALKKELDGDFDALRQKYRVAALVHDIGHYPFSHAFEDALSDEYGSSAVGLELVSDGENPTEPLSTTSGALKHEEASAQVLTLDSELQEVLDAAGLKVADLTAIISNEQPKILNLVSSDLDADRIDYLMRTSKHSGLPYGSVDFDYILSQVRLNDNRLCLSEKAIKAADHFLLCRYFDFQQVAYHKTVTGLEKVLQEVLRRLIQTSAVDWSKDAIIEMIQGEMWQHFDDAYMWLKFRATFAETEDEELRSMLHCLLRRQPPALVAEIEFVDNSTEERNRRYFKGTLKAISDKIDAWAEEFEIPRNLWFQWKKSPKLTSIGARVSVSALQSDGDLEMEGYEPSIRILHSNGDCKLIVNEERSLMKVLSEQALYMYRLYVILAEGQEDKRGAIEARIKGDFPHSGIA